jgi:hypothetical protein
MAMKGTITLKKQSTEAPQLVNGQLDPEDGGVTLL